jgi:hypothetical protein
VFQRDKAAHTYIAAAHPKIREKKKEKGMGVIVREKWRDRPPFVSRKKRLFFCMSFIFSFGE